VLPLDREVLGESVRAGIAPDLLRDLVSTQAPTAEASVVAQLLALPAGRLRARHQTQHCVGQAARVLKQDEQLVDVHRPLAAMGFDSLMSLELRKRLETSLGITLPATVVWRFPTIEALVPFLAEQLGVSLAADAPDVPGPDISGPDVPDPHDLDDGPDLGPDLGADLDEDLDDLSADELAGLLVDSIRRYEGQ